MKILNVDDRAENLYMLEALLRGHGHEVDSASNGLTALELAQRGVYDLIVSDILMPRMDGFQFCRELKKDSRLSQIPFIFYTATYTDPKDAAFALGLGADRFLIKPLEPEQFMKAIEEVVAETRKSAAAIDAEPPPEDEAIYLKEYNARLIAKLEKKMLDLEAANRALTEDIRERERAAKERAKLENRLRQAQKLEAIGTLAGGIAHDFNNILSGIIGFADLGIQDAADPRISTENFREILKASFRARDLVRQILAFSRHREQDRKPVNLEDALLEALRMLRATIPAAIALETQIEPGTPAVLADSTQVHQIVTNLVTNAWHAIGEKPGTITLQLNVFPVDPDFAQTHPDLRPGRYVRLTISDSGRGIPADVLEHIFEPFFTTKPTGEGTGLGLSVVHGLMKAFDGAITVYSEPGQGTTFHLYFPAMEFGGTEAQPVETPEPFGQGERVLFVDDEPVLAMLGQRFLARLGYTPVVQPDPHAALTTFQEASVDVVVTDLNMPSLNGIDFAQKIWRIRPDARIILTTGFSAALDGDRARELGFREMLLKPYTARSLGAAIQRALKS